MGQEFIIKSQAIEDKINQLLPSQGGFQAGVDFSASTTVIPIIDLTETAEGSDVRQDLQSALSLNSITSFTVSNTASTLVNTTGYFRVFGTIAFLSDAVATRSGKFSLTDGITSKDIITFNAIDGATNNETSLFSYDFLVFLKASDSLTATVSTGAILDGCTRQIADINGNLTNP